MQKVKKICCQITPRRIIGAILLAATVANLVIVGAAFEVTFPVPTFTETQTSPPVTAILSPTAPLGYTPAMTVTMETSTPTPTLTLTGTPTSTATDTATATFTNTPSPSPTLCVPIYFWPVYIVQRGDWLQAIAGITGSSVPELIRANCLVDTVIYPGQQLHVPRLPLTPTHTFTVQPNTSTGFQGQSVCVNQGTGDIGFSVTADDPEGISDVTLSYSIQNGPGFEGIAMQPNGNVYFASIPDTGQYIQFPLSYSFTATDTLGSITESDVYSEYLKTCFLLIAQ